MLKIEETDVPVFPEDDFLENYEGCDVATLIFMLAIDASVGDGIRQLGDSSIYIMAEPTGNKNDKGLAELEKYIKEFFKIVRKSIPFMSCKYANFFEYFLSDYDVNGFVIPAYEYAGILKSRNAHKGLTGEE